MPTYKANDEAVNHVRKLIDAGAYDDEGRYAFPYGDFTKANRAALTHAKQRAAQDDHGAITKAADDLLERLDEKRS